METKAPHSRLLDRAFYISLYVKAADGVLQLIGGIALLFLRPAQLKWPQAYLASHIDGDRGDIVFRYLSTALSHVTGGSIRFAAFYLIGDAALKLILIHEILHKRYWAYLGLIAVLSVLVMYQSYRIWLHHSIFLSVLTLFDLLVIYLSAQEYRRHQRSLAASAAARE